MLEADSTAPAGDSGVIFVDSTDILYLDSYPVEVNLVVAGLLPTPCHKPVYGVQDLGASIDVLRCRLADPEMMWL